MTKETLSNIVYEDYLETKDVVKSIKKYLSNIDISTIAITLTIKSLRLNHPNIFKDIEDKVKHLYEINKKLTYEKLIRYYIFDQLHPCPICGKLALNTSISCSIQCQGKLESVKEKRKQTCLEKYGVKNPFQDTDKIKNTMLKRYGVEYATQIDGWKEKTRKTCLEKYGVEWHSQAKQVKKKIENTCLEKYGVRVSSQSEQAKEAQKKTNLEKYGTVSPSQNEDIKKKVNETFIKRYGKNRYIDSEKFKKNYLKNHGVEHPNQRHYENYNDLNEEFVKANFIQNNKFMIDEFCQYFNIGLGTAKDYKKKFNIYNVSNNYVRSRGELELFNSINVNLKFMDDRQLIKPYELDIVIPEHKLAIEYDGVYWHSKCNENYHLNKTLLCLEKGYQLFHIFDYEDKEIWKSIINNRLNFNKKIYARKCEIKEIDIETAKDFCFKNHLEGYVESTNRYGLFYNDKLVQVMLFNITDMCELTRLCSLKNYTIVGGASKLFKHFTEKYDLAVITKADLRYSNGTIYKKLGFSKIGFVKPTPKYVSYHDIKYMDDGKKKYYKVYDCGNAVFLFNK